MDVIIGAGITGLCYAMFSNNPNYIILEKEPEIGGYCRTIKRNGFVWDYSGHFFHFRDSYIRDLILSGIKDNMLTLDKHTRIKYKDIFVDYPFQKNIHQLSKAELIDCLYDLFTERNDEYSNFQEMLYSKFGKSIAEKFLIPYNEKLYACNLNDLDKDAMGRFFPYAEREEIIRNFKVNNNTSYNDKFLYPQNGAMEYVKSVYNKIDKSRILLNTQVDHISISESKITLSTGEEINYDRLISTIPFPELLRISNTEYDPSVYTWNKVLVFNLGFDVKGNDTVDHWLYFPEKKYCFYRVGFYDNILNQGCMSLYVELGFDKNDLINPSEWLGRVISDLRKAEIVRPDQTLVDYESIIMDPAYVHINSRSIVDVAAKKKELAKYHVYSIGRYGSWCYCSIEDNIKEAQILAANIL